MDKQNVIQWCKIILMMITIMALGMLFINQTFGWYYKAQLLAGPCKLCVDKNPDWKRCWDYESKPRYVQANITNNMDLTRLEEALKQNK